MTQSRTIAMDDLDGYDVFGEPGGFVHRNGPIYINRKGGDGPVTKMLLTPQHVNSLDIASGGLLMTMLDITIGATVSARVGCPGICPTVQFNCNLISAARKGDVLTGEAEVSHTTRSLAFATGRLMAGDRVVATASGVFKIPSVARDANGRAETGKAGGAQSRQA
jgi:acyl-coenzyme A thioesterase PaaI-like protein